MAKKRCLSIDFYQNDDFITLDPTVINLYTYLNLYADDYGIVANPKTVIRMCGATEKDMNILLENGYIIMFDSKKVAITHWLQHNQIQPSKLTIATNLYELKQLLVIDDKREYILVSDERAEELRKNGEVSPPQYKNIEGKTVQYSPTNQEEIEIYSEENKGELLRGKKSTDKKTDKECIEELERMRKSKP